VVVEATEADDEWDGTHLLVLFSTYEGDERIFF
jgi:hypothetical protein